MQALLVAMTASVVPALAQGPPPGPVIGTDLSGEWAARGRPVHETES